MQNDMKHSLQNDPLFRVLPAGEQEYIIETAASLRLSYQYLRTLIEISSDLAMWDDGSLKEKLSPILAEKGVLKLGGTQRNARIIALLQEHMDRLREEETDYDEFTSSRPSAPKHVFVDRLDPGQTLLGSCPVAGEKTRCCNLLTLDAVQQCGYGCSYCSIQSFYDEQKIFFHSDLKQRLKDLSASLDPDKIYHIGTGQSSDSLMFGNHAGLLDALLEFARDNPRVILELKTKSDNISYLADYPGTLPKNLVCTWSLNTQTIIEKEEHLTASLEKRLNAARRAADRGILVGFHIHPMIRYKGWREAYRALIQEVQEKFSPSEIVLVSLGTLTFIRPVLKRLRSMGLKSRVLRIPLSEASGKLSYPMDIKQELFSFAYGCFREAWKHQVFFYLCMEPEELWNPVFGYSYRDNTTFEQTMKQAYMDKITASRDRE